MAVRSFAAAAAALALATPACADTDRSADAWRALTEADVNAAYALLKEDHPAAAPALDDQAFRTALEQGRTLALARAAEVRSMEGYVSVLAGFANGFGDKHVWSRPLYRADNLQWAGLAIARREAGWIVASEAAPSPYGSSLLDHALVSCDGVAADALAQARLGDFRAEWSSPAQRVQHAPYLLVNDGNPFLPRPKTCVFRKGETTREVALSWTPVTRADFRPHLRKAAAVGAAGFGVRSFAGGVWIALESLDGRAAPVVEAVRARAAELRQAPVVVLDLRGNGGGSSSFGRQIADALLGEAYTGRVLGNGAELGGCSPVWRASPRNLARLDYYRRELAPKVGDDFVALNARQLADAQTAAAEGADFGPALDCKPATPQTARGPAPRPASRGVLVLLTDNACFSSCLIVTDEFRKLGAVHAGQATDANTRYFEVREDALPSGLSMFSTLQAVSLASPYRIGPFVPAASFDGDVTDTKALETWVAARFGPAARTP